ncbi:hypothetical protein ACTXT7_015282 [Hymenolepis weldensis]
MTVHNVINKKDKTSVADPLASYSLAPPRSPLLVLFVEWFVIGDMQKKGRYDWCRAILSNYTNYIWAVPWAAKLTARTQEWRGLQHHQDSHLIGKAVGRLVGEAASRDLMCIVADRELGAREVLT